MLLLMLCVECDAACTSGCLAQGTDKCDKACASGYSLNTTDYTCMRASFFLSLSLFTRYFAVERKTTALYFTNVLLTEFSRISYFYVFR